MNFSTYLAQLPVLAYVVGLFAGFAVGQLIKAHRLKVFGKKPSKLCIQAWCAATAALFTAAVAFRLEKLDPIDCLIHGSVMILGAPYIVRWAMTWSEKGAEGSVRRIFYDAARITRDPPPPTPDSPRPNDSQSVETGTWWR